MSPPERSLAAQLERFRADVARDFEELDRKNERRETSTRALLGSLEAHLDRQDAVNGSVLKWLMWLSEAMGGMSSEDFEELKGRLAQSRSRLEAAIAANREDDSTKAGPPTPSQEETHHGQP